MVAAFPLAKELFQAVKELVSWSVPNLSFAGCVMNAGADLALAQRGLVSRHRYIQCAVRGQLLSAVGSRSVVAG